MDRAARIGVVGAGLIGGSIIGALSGDPRLAAGLVAHDADPATRARIAGAGVRVAADPAALARAVDLAIVAVPPAATAGVAAALLEAAPALVVSDAASVKRSVFDAVAARVDPAALARFVPGHPLAGGEGRGWQAARPDLLAGAVWALCPDPARTDLEATLGVIELVTGPLGARALTVELDRHDAVMAHTSHMPHLLASALVGTLVEREGDLRLRMSGGALRDATRIAAANPDLWVEILRDNAGNVTAALDALIERLADLRAMLAEGRLDDLAGAWQRGARGRDRLERLRWRPDAAGRRVECERSLAALLRLGAQGAVIRRLLARSPRLTLELAHD